MKINKSLPNIRKYYLTYDKEKKVNINNIYIPHKPYNSGLKIKKNIINIDNKYKRKLKKNNDNKEDRFINEIQINDNKNRNLLNCKRVLFNDDNKLKEEEDDDDDIINQWIYLVNKYIKMYNKKLLNTNIQKNNTKFKNSENIKK